MTSATYKSAFIDIIAAPGDLFEGLTSSKGYSWLAFFLLIGISASCIVLFFNGMSTDWVVEQQMLQLTEESEADKQVIREYLTENAKYFGTLGAVFNSVFLLVMIVVLAGYFKLIGNRASQFGFNDWFAFSVWTQFPIVIQMLGFAALFLSAGTADLPITLLNYASVNQLFIGLTPEHTHFQLAETISVFYLWSIVLGAKGLQRWAKFPAAKSYTYSALPYVLFFVIWAVTAG